MSKTCKGLLEHCKKAKTWKYVYGAKGQVLTRTQIQNLKNRYGSLVWNSDLNKAGNICCDCSGLISSYTGIIRSSANYKSTATSIATISQLKANWKAYVGWGIWMNGHIGIVSDREGYYYAMDGSARNWVHYPISKNKWTYVIKLKDIDYTSATPAKPDIIYAAYTERWLPAVTNNTDYAGIEGRPIKGIMIKLSTGEPIRYRAHCNGKWYGWVTGYNSSDYNNGYAGDCKNVIDAIEIKCDNYDIRYKVSNTQSSKYYSEVQDSANDYAGVFGRPIDKLMCRIL